MIKKTTFSWPKRTAVSLLLLLPLLFNYCGHQNPRSRETHADREGWIGVYVQDVDGELRRYYDLDARSGVLINEIVEDSPAEKAGLRDEDIIVKFDGKRIRRTGDLTRLVRRKQPNDRVQVGIVRDGKKKKLTLRIAEKPERLYRDFNSRLFSRPRDYSFSRGYGAWLGVRLADLNDDLAGYFDVDEHDGALVLSVEEDSPAEQAKIKSGDVILKIDRRRVRDSEDVLEIISNLEAGDEVEIQIKRRGRTQSIRAELTSNPHRNRFNFNRDHWREWREEMKHWKNDLRKQLRGWNKQRHRSRLNDLHEKNQRQLGKNIKRNMERSLDVNFYLEAVEDEIDSAMDNVHKELEKVTFELEFIY